MATALFSTMINRLAANAPGAPHPVLTSHIRTAAISACERTGAWRYEHAIYHLKHWKRYINYILSTHLV